MTKYTSDKGMQNLFEGFKRFLNERGMDPGADLRMRQKQAIQNAEQDGGEEFTNIWFETKPNGVQLKNALSKSTDNVNSAEEVISALQQVKQARPDAQVIVKAQLRIMAASGETLVLFPSDGGAPIMALKYIESQLG